MNQHRLKTYSGHHILSYHNTQNTPRAYVGKPTCFKQIKAKKLLSYQHEIRNLFPINKASNCVISN